MNANEPNDRFPTFQIIALMVVLVIAALIDNSIIMLVSALLPTPLLLWRFFIAMDEWETRRAKNAPNRAEPTITNEPATSPLKTFDQS